MIDALDPLNPGILYFPQGTYLILGGPLLFIRFEGLWIQGAGAATVLDGQGGSILWLLGCRSTRVSHLSFVHGSGTAITISPADSPGGLSLLPLQLSRDVRIEACRFDGTGDDLNTTGREHCAVRAIAVDGITIADNTLVGSQIQGGLPTDSEEWTDAGQKAGAALIRGNIITDAVDGAISWGSRSALATVSSVEIVGNIIDGFGWSGIRLGWDIVGQPGGLRRVLVRNNVVKASARSRRAPAIYGWAGPGSEDWTIDGNIVTTVDATPDRQYGILVETEGLWRLELYDGSSPPPQQPDRAVVFPGFDSHLLAPGSLGSLAPPPGRSFDEVGVAIPLGIVLEAAEPGDLRSLSISGNSVSAMDRAGICVRGAVSAYGVSGNLVGGPEGPEPSPATQGIWIRSTGVEGQVLDGVVSANVVEGLDHGILISTRAGRQNYLAGRIGDLGPVLVHDNICKNSRALNRDASAAGITLECVAGTTARVNLQANRCYDDRAAWERTQDFGLMTLGDGALALFDPGNNDFSDNGEERSHDDRIPDDLGFGGDLGGFQDPFGFGGN